MSLFLLALLAAAPERAFSEERLLLDRRLETLRRILPDGATAGSDVVVLRELAEQARLMRVEVASRPPVEAGPRGEVPIEVNAVGRFADVDRFFRQVGLHHRLLDVESVTLTATPEHVVKLQAVVRAPFRPVKAPLPPPPDGTRARVPGVPKAQADAFVRDQALALAKADGIAQLRRARRNPRLFLSEVAAVTRDRPVVLTHAAWSEDFSIRGLSVGEGPVRALESRFEKGFFRVSEFLMARQAACHRFEVRGRCPVAGPEAELPLPADDPFAQDQSPCRIDRDESARSFVVKPQKEKTPAQGQITLRLRDVDVADVFQVLSLVSGQGFVVDGDVTGRVAFDASKLTLEQAIAVLEKGGLVVTDAGTLKRVSSARPAFRPAPTPPGGPTVSFQLKRAEVREVLAVMTEMDPALAALGPEGQLGRVSIWAKDVPLADLRAVLLMSAGLTERFEEGRRIVERQGTEEKLLPVAGTPPERRLVLRAEDLTLREFEPLGLASAGTTWLAWAYAPTGALLPFRVGDRLADAVIRSVDAQDVVVETDEGPLRLPVAAPAR
jgi:hypothetical protein